MDNQKTLEYQRYIPGLDGLRALAIVCVILYHMELIPGFKGGFIGVDLFFVLSGYVIARSLYSREISNFAGYLADFYKRRVLRIVPALLFCLLLVHLLAVFLIPHAWSHRILENTGIAALLGVGNLSQVWWNQGYFSTLSSYNPFLHSWSLSLEEQFYLLFPLVFFLWLRYRQRKSLLGLTARWILPLITAVSLGLAIHSSGTNPRQAYFLLHNRFWELAAGVLLFQYQVEGNGKKMGPRLTGLAMLGGAILLVLGLVFSGSHGFPFPWAMAPVLAGILWIHGMTQSQDGGYPGSKLMENPITQWIGKMSYSLYLWHWPVIVLLRWTWGYDSWFIKLLSLVPILGLSALSYYGVENPLRRNVALKEASRRIVLLGGLFSLLLSAGTASLLHWNWSRLTWSITMDQYIWNAWHHWQDRAEEPVYDFEDRQIFIMGDSHTASYRSMMNIVSTRLGVTVHEYERGDCDIAGLLEPMEDHNIDHYRRSMEDIRAMAKPGDLVFLAALRMPLLSYRFESVDPQDVLEEHFSAEAVENRRIALEEAHQVINQLEELGLRVLIDAPKPVVRIPPYRCSDWFNRGNPIAEPGPEVDLELLETLRQPVMDSLEELQRRHPTLLVWDPLPHFVQGSVVSAYDQQGRALFRDGDHLSGQGSRMLAPHFEEFLLEAGVFW